MVSNKEHWLRLNKAFTIGITVILLLSLMGVAAPWIAPHDPELPNYDQILEAPSRDYLLGTDQFGRCIFSRLLYGARISLAVGVIIGGTTAVIGTLAGLIAGYFGGIIDELFMRLIDVLMGIPNLILVIAMVGILGPSLKNTLLALIVTGWLQYARMVRGSVLSLKKSEFVLAAKTLGFSSARIMFRHILPNVLRTIIVMATFSIPHSILAVASLSFLGLGAQPPTPEWGAMLNASRSYMLTNPQMVIMPVTMIFLTVMSFNLLGNSLQEIMGTKRNSSKHATG